ncbi:methenyltetrahydrofolate cyclohydrolase [Candidatus Methylocalor cossyra]|uniref:Methenyltetrahydrofolate cyclohydrolase n=1 Tax=Candidatus Methylocalor cossyra TaxID=3108543 RepID=A0ABM9NGY1_9GAMM
MTKDQSIQQFLDTLASKTPTPGGGSAAAIMGAMGAALVSMACNLTIGKPGYQAVEAELREVLAAAEGLRTRLTDLVQADIEAFDRVMDAYGMPKDSEEQKRARSIAIQEALKQATEVPLECARASAEVIRLSRIAAEKSNRNVVSDAGVAAVAGHAALRSAALNVQVNTGAIKDTAFSAARLEELQRILAQAGEASEATYHMAKTRL